MRQTHATVLGMAIHDMHGDAPEVLTPAEAMRALRISRSTLDRYVANGLMTPIRLPSGHRRFASSDVEAILARAPWAPAS